MAKKLTYVQVSREYMRDWRGLIRRNSLSAEILMFLMEKMTHRTNAVVCSYRVLMEMTGFSRSSVANSIKLLKDEHWIQAIKVGSATAYVVNERIAWRSSQESRKYAVFSAVVVAAASEQKAGFEDAQELRQVAFIEDGERVVLGSDLLPPPDQQDLDLQ